MTGVLAAQINTPEVSGASLDKVIRALDPVWSVLNSRGAILGLVGVVGIILVAKGGWIVRSFMVAIGLLALGAWDSSTHVMTAAVGGNQQVADRILQVSVSAAALLIAIGVMGVKIRAKQADRPAPRPEERGRAKGRRR